MLEATLQSFSADGQVHVVPARQPAWSWRSLCGVPVVPVQTACLVVDATGVVVCHACNQVLHDRHHGRFTLLGQQVPPHAR